MIIVLILNLLFSDNVEQTEMATGAILMLLPEYRFGQGGAMKPMDIPWQTTCSIYCFRGIFRELAPC